MSRLVLAVLATLAAAPALANEIFASDPKTVVVALQDQGFRASLESNDQGEPYVQSSVSGYNFAVNFYGCTNNAECQWLEFASSFTLQEPATPKTMNDWNANNLFAAGYVAQNGDAVLSYTVTTVGGLTRDNFNDVLARWELSVGDFVRHIGY